MGAFDGMLTASPGRQRHRTHATQRCFRDTARELFAAPIAMRRARYAHTHKHTCKTNLVTDSAFCYHPYAALCFFLLACTLEYLAKWVFMWWVEFDTNQTLPQHAGAAGSAGSCVYTILCMQRRHCSWALPCPRAAIFIILFPPFWDRNLGRACRKGHDGNASCCRGKGNLLRASRAMTEGIDGNSMPSVISGLHHRSELVLLAWIFFVHVVGSQNLHKLKSDASKPNHVAFTKYFP